MIQVNDIQKVPFVNGGAGGRGNSVSPISTRGAAYAHDSTTCPLYFQTATVLHVNALPWSKVLLPKAFNVLT